MECEKAALMTSLQESQTQLHHTQGALNEQHEKTLLLNQKITDLHRAQCRASQNQKAQSSPTSQLPSEALMELYQGDEQQAEEEGRAEEAENETLGKSKIFSYQTPGLEILQCKYRVAVTEVVELKAEVKALKDRLAQDDKPRPNDQLDKLRRQLSSSEQSCHEGQQKVSAVILSVPDSAAGRHGDKGRHPFPSLDNQPGIRASQSSGRDWREPGGPECSSGRVGDAERGAGAALPSRLSVQQ